MEMVAARYMGMDYGQNHVVNMSLQARIQKIWSGQTRWQAPLAEYSTLGVGGMAAALLEPASSTELVGLLAGLRGAAIPWRVIGRGSNVLFADAGFAGAIIMLGRRFAGKKIIAEDGDRVIVRVEAGCGLGRLLNWCVDNGLTGLEFAAGIPGTVGGAIIMNAGAWGREIKDVLAGINYIDGRGALVHGERAAMNFAYRSWLDGKDKVVVSGDFTFRRGVKADIRALCRELTVRRVAKQPKVAASAGSFFKNPLQGPAAGRLIEDAGLKGCRVGGAMVSPAHANFIVNDGGATAADILALMRMVQEKVKDMSGVSLQPEVHIIDGLEKKSIVPL